MQCCAAGRSLYRGFGVDIIHPGTEADIEAARDALVYARTIMDWAMSLLDSNGQGQEA